MIQDTKNQTAIQSLEEVIKTPKRSVIPRSKKQKEYVRSLKTNQIVMSLGPAGTGKTYLAVAVALSMLLDKKVERINISISENGDYAINEAPLRTSTINNIVTNLKNAANAIKDPVIVISADSDSPHQSVINVMEAARIAGLSKITFSTKVK